MVRISLKRYEQLKRREGAYLGMLSGETAAVRAERECNGWGGRWLWNLISFLTGAAILGAAVWLGS